MCASRRKIAGPSGVSYDRMPSNTPVPYCSACALTCTCAASHGSSSPFIQTNSVFVNPAMRSPPRRDRNKAAEIYSVSVRFSVRVRRPCRYALSWRDELERRAGNGNCHCNFFGGSTRNSGKCRADLEEEVGIVAIAVGHALQDLDLVVHTLEQPGVERIPAVIDDVGVPLLELTRKAHQRR